MRETPETYTDEVRALAEQQAARDAELMEQLRDRMETAGPFEVDLADHEALEEASPSEALRPLNRAERRQMVEQFKANLRLLPRTTSVHNATIIPKSKRRKRR